MTHDILAVVSDLHVGSTLGLIPSSGADLDDGGHYRPNDAQLWLHSCFVNFTQRVRASVKRGDQLHVIVNGDAVDRITKSAQVWSVNDVDVIRAAVNVLGPLREMVKGGGFFVVRGTETHVGLSGALEEALAVQLRATPWPADAATRSVFYLRLQLSGVGIDVAHHGRAGTHEWTRTNPLGAMAVNLALEYAKHDERLPALAIRSHTHRYADSGDNFPIRMLATPAWQLQTAYGQKIAPGRLPDIGGVLVACEGGRADVTCVRYLPQREAAWTA